MKEGDRVSILWPGGGITQNIKVAGYSNNYFPDKVDVEFDGMVIRIPKAWCTMEQKLTERKIVEGDVVYVTWPTDGIYNVKYADREHKERGERSGYIPIQVSAVDKIGSFYYSVPEVLCEIVNIKNNR